MVTIESTSWHSYPSIYALGHRTVADLFKSRVRIEEKVDGSQFSFGVFDGEYRARSKGAVLNLIAPEGMFIKAIEATKDLPLIEGWTYRGEYLAKPKHNSLVYERHPKRHVILFDINTGHEEYADRATLEREAERLGMECVPLLYDGVVEDMSVLRAMLSTTSVLGGQHVEGVVVKSYDQYGPDKKLLMGKYVSESFKEVHAREWKRSNPSGKDFIQQIADKYHTQARWQKAVQHLKERGELTQSPRDIGLLIVEAAADIKKEEEEEIKSALFKYAWPKIQRIVTAGLPEWYKEELLKVQFDEPSEVSLEEDTEDN